MDSAVLVLSALLLNAALGVRRWYAPLRPQRVTGLPARLVRDVERRLDREHRGLKERERRGALLVALAFAACLAAGLVGGWLFKQNLHFVEIALMTVLLPLRPIWDRASSIHQSLKAGNVAQARLALDEKLWRHRAVMDEAGLARAGIETLAVGFAEKILAPILWYFILGLTGLFFSRALTLIVETLQSPAQEEGFARAARGAHYLLHYLPSRLAAGLWLMALLFLPSGKPGEAARDIREGGLDTAPPQRIDLLAAASALKLSLGGPSSVYAADKAWVGKGPVRALPQDMARALYLFALLHLFLFILLGLFF